MLRVNQLINQADARTEELAQAILCDPGLSARLLRLANSACYGARRRVEIVSQAIVLLGQREWRNLVTTTITVLLFEGLPADQINIDQFCNIAS